MSTSNINDVFVLSSYTSSARGKSAAKYAPGVYASSSKKAKSSDGFVTVAVQGDGVHVLDVSALHPAISHTLGPSTSFACAPLILPSSSNASRTYVVISSSPDLSSTEEAGRTLWMWQDDASKSKQKEKRTNVIFSKNEAAYGLYACEELPERIVAISNTGSLTILDADSLEVKSTFDSTSSTVLHASVFPGSTPFFPSSQKGVFVVLVSSGSSKTTHLRIFAIDEADSIALKQESEICAESEKIASISCSKTGVLSVLTVDGQWDSYRLAPESSSQLEPLSSPLHLSGFSFLSEASKLPVSLLALTSSHVLLAAIASQEITLLLWDLQFSVLLASHTFAVPSALSSTKLHIRLVPGIDTSSKSGAQVIGQAVLILSSIPSGEKSDSSKTVSVLVVVPYTLPALSTIAGALGRGDAGKKWLRTLEEGKEKSAEEKARLKLLDTMRSAMQSGRPQAASAAFMKWAPKTDDAHSSEMDYNFVKEVLTIFLGLPSESKAKPIPAGPGSYTPEVVRYLLERHVVCSNMVPSSTGLLGALRTRDDWTSIELAFSTVLDLTESEIVECLGVVVRQGRLATSNTGSALEDAMQVDSPASSASSSVSSLPSFLKLLASYPTSRAPLVLAFRKHLRDAEDLTTVMQVLDRWVAKKVRMDERLLPSKKDLKKNEQGVWIVIGRKGDKEKTEDVPSLSKIVDLLQVILDACFLPILQHPPAHKVLRKLQEKLAPEISFVAAVESLRGPLEPFAVAQEKAIKESLVSPEEREREKQKIDWRQRRKGMDVGADIGLYRLEELVL